MASTVRSEEKDTATSEKKGTASSEKKDTAASGKKSRQPVPAAEGKKKAATPAAIGRAPSQPAIATLLEGEQYSHSALAFGE